MTLLQAHPESSDAILGDITARTMRLAREILAQQARTPAFEPEDALVDAGLSSLDLVNLMVSVEIEFDLMIPPTQLNPKNFSSVSSIARMIASLTSRRDSERTAA